MPPYVCTHWDKTHLDMLHDSTFSTVSLQAVSTFPLMRFSCGVPIQFSLSDVYFQPLFNSICIILLTGRAFPLSQSAGQKLTSSWFSEIVLPTICYLFSAQCVLKCIAVFFKYLAAKSKPSKCRRLYFYFARVVFWMYQKTCLFYIFLCTKWLWLPLCTNSPMHEKLFSVNYYTVSGHKHSGPFSAGIRFIFTCIFVFPRPGRWWPEGEDPKTSISWPARCVSGTNRWVVCVCALLRSLEKKTSGPL